MTARRRSTGLALACAFTVTALAGCNTSASTGTGTGSSGTGSASSVPATGVNGSGVAAGSGSASVPQAATGSSPASPTPPVAQTVIASTPGRSTTAAAILMLQTDGLGVLASGASIRQLPFGTALSQVKQALAATLGPVRTSASPECGQGPRTSLDAGGFGALFDGSKFVGWTDTGRTARAARSAVRARAPRWVGADSAPCSTAPRSSAGPTPAAPDAG
jgi:hypothetical protein